MEWYKNGAQNEGLSRLYKWKENGGHTCPWDCGLAKREKYYVVTDSDLDLSNTPDDTLVYLLEKLQSLKLDKLGLGLDFSKVPENSPYYAHMNNYERPRWLRSRFEQEIALDVAIDTTFALYSVPYYFIGGGSTTKPYIARHLPWEFTIEEREKNEEFMYYIKNASNSSSYKTFLKL